MNLASLSTGHLRHKVALATVVALIMWRMKRYYADATVDDLRWMLDPTARLVTTLTGAPFQWELGEGYLSRERLFLIEKVCAGINFMIAAFGMVAWTLRRRIVSWVSGAAVLAASILAAYSTAVLVNTARIAFAMWLAAHPGRVPWLTAPQAHRVEGIAFYFGGLMLLFELVHWFDRRDQARRVATPLLWYYAITILIPLSNGAAGQGPAFAEYALFVLVVPPLFIALAALCMLSIRACSPSDAPPLASQWPSRSAAVRPRWGRLSPRNRRRSSSRARQVNPAV